MRVHLVFSLALLSAAASPARGAEFVAGWNTEVIYDTNVFQTLDEDQLGRKIPKEDDFSLRTGPNVRLRERQGDLRYDLLYQLRYEEFARLDGISQFDHFANAQGQWDLDDRTTFFGSNNFGYSSSIGGLFDFGVNVQPVVTATRIRVTSNTGEFGFRRRLGPRWELTGSGQTEYYAFDPEEQESVDTSSRSLGGTFQLTRGITPRLIAGVGGQFQRQRFDNGQGLPDDSTDIFQGFGLVRYSLSRTMRVSASVGPAWSQSDASDTGEREVPTYVPVLVSTCPVRDDGTPFISQAQAAGFRVSGPACTPITSVTDSDGDRAFPFRSTESATVPFVGETGGSGELSYFGRIGLEKEWRQWLAVLSYSRSASSGSGLGTTTILDSFQGELTWTPTTNWTVKLLGGLSMQSALSELRAQQIALRAETRLVTVIGTDGVVQQVPIEVGVPFEVSSGDKIDNPIDVRTYRVELRADRRITRRLTANGAATFYGQKSSSDFQDSQRTIYRVILGLTWTFDPIPL